MSDEVIPLLQELIAWTKLSNRSLLIQLLTDTLKGASHIKAYEASDGTRSQSEVATAAGVSIATVSNLWASWRRMGIVLEAGGGRVRHLALPSDLGLQPS